MSTICQENLLLNSSFESLNCNPLDHNYFQCVNNWINLNNTSLDIWLRNPNEAGSGFYNNSVGSQNSAHGDAYSGLINCKRNFSMSQPFTGPFFYDPVVQSHTMSYDVLGGVISTPLNAGKIYSLNFFISVADKTYKNASSSWLATNCLDVYALRETDIDLSDPDNYGKRVYSNNSILTDTTNWLKMSSCFIADGTEQVFAFGCMRDTNQIMIEENIDWGNDFSVISYLFLDNVSLYECDTCCLGEFPYEDHVNVSNNPGNSGSPTVFTIVLNGNTTAELTLYDSAGRLVARNEFAEMVSNYTLPVDLANAVYHYSFRSSNGAKQYGKILVSP